MDKDQVTPELVNWLKDAAEKGGAFVEREAPLFATEVVAWHFWSHVFLAVFIGLAGVALTIAAVIVLRIGLRGMKDLADYSPPCLVFGAIGVIGGPVMVVMGIGVNGYEATKAAVAPRVVIVEYLTGAVK